MSLFSTRYREALLKKIDELEQAISSGVGSWEVYKESVGVRRGLTQALVLYNEVLKDFVDDPDDIPRN